MTMHSRLRAAMLFLGFLCLLFNTPTFAQTAINFQGVLVEDQAEPDTGDPVPLTGARTLAVRLWNVAIAGASGEDLLWAQAYRVNLNADGYFSILIGPPGVAESEAVLGAPNTSDLLVALSDGPAFLGVTVIRDENGELTGRDEYYPRRQLLSAPFAIFTDFAAKIGREPEVEEVPPRIKYTSGRTASTLETNMDEPTVVVAEVRDFPVRPGALLRVSYTAPLEFNFDELFPLQDINLDFPPPPARVTLDVRANDASLARIRTDQGHSRPEFDLVLPEGPEKVRPVFLNWVGVINPMTDDPFMRDTLVSVNVRLSMFDAVNFPPVNRVIDVERPGSGTGPDDFSTFLGMARNNANETVFSPKFNVRHGDSITWDRLGSANHEIVFLDDVLGGGLNFSLNAMMDTHTLEISDALPIGATFRYHCSLHPAINEPPQQFTVVEYLDYAAIADTTTQRLMLEEILPDQLESTEP